jgi:hypothetical protein
LANVKSITYKNVLARPARFSRNPREAGQSGGPLPALWDQHTIRSFPDKVHRVDLVDNDNCPSGGVRRYFQRCPHPLQKGKKQLLNAK